jgi:hypothetical protein
LRQGVIMYYSPGWPQTHYIFHAVLEVEILLLLPPKCWDYRCVPSHPGINNS